MTLYSGMGASIGLAGGDTKLYAYAFNNPLAFDDPSGLLEFDSPSCTVLGLVGCSAIGGLVVLAEHPAERARLQANPTLLDSGIEEILRWTSPLHHMSREATEDVEIRGKKIRAGDRVLMFYPSANRDEDVFPEPYRFDVTRSPNDHLAFGIGEHFCLGAGFARKEVKVMFQELFRRLPKLEVTGPPERLRSNFINGVKHLPVRV